MLTASYIGDGTIARRELEPRPPGPDDVQIRVAYVGLCGTDLHIVHGHMDARVRPPMPIGHEMSGMVEAVGSPDSRWRPGDAVTVMPLSWDGTCPACRAGHQHVCQNLEFLGIDSPGALQQLWTVPESTLVALPAGMRLDHAALVEPVAVAVHDVRRSGLGTADKVVVSGGGPIGVLIASVARWKGAEVRVLEPDATRRSQLEALGFAAIDPLFDDPVAWVEQWTESAGADVAFEVSGSAEAVSGATALVKVRGTLVVVAIHPKPREIDLHRVFWRELTILGARVYERADFEAAVDLLHRGVIPADALITSIVPLSGTQAAFADLAAGRAMKVLVDVRSETGEGR